MMMEEREERNRMIDAEIGKLLAETAKLNGEVSKIAAETAKINRERFMVPLIAISGAVAAFSAGLVAVARFIVA